MKKYSPTNAIIDGASGAIVDGYHRFNLPENSVIADEQALVQELKNNIRRRANAVEQGPALQQILRWLQD